MQDRGERILCWMVFLGTRQSLGYETYSVGSTPETADAGSELILSGVKTTTSSLLWQYQVTGKPMLEAGSLSICLNANGGTPSASLRRPPSRCGPSTRSTRRLRTASGVGPWRAGGRGLGRSTPGSAAGWGKNRLSICLFCASGFRWCTRLGQGEQLLRNACRNVLRILALWPNQETDRLNRMWAQAS